MTSTSNAVPAQTGRMILLLALAAFASASAFRVCDPLLPLLAQEFGTTVGAVSGVVTLFAVAYGVMQFFFGPLGDRYGKFRVIVIATLLCAIGSIGAALAGRLDVLVLCRFLSGAAAAGIIPLSMAWIGDNVAYEQRQVMLARFVTGTILGMAGGQIIGGVFADTLGWRGAFVFLALGYLLVGGLLLRELRRMPVAGTPAAERVPYLTALAGMLGSRWVRAVLLTVFIEGAVVFGLFAFIPAFLQMQYGLSPTVAGLVAAVFALGGIAYVLASRRLVPALGERGLSAAGGGVLAVAFLVFLLGPSWHWAVLASLGAGFGFYLLHSTLQTNATQMAPRTRGTAVALFASCLFLGQSAGAALSGFMIDGLGMQWLLAGAVVLIPLVGLGFAWALRLRPMSA